MEQLSLFDNEMEQVARAFGENIIEVLNSVNTKWKDTFYIGNVEIEKWEHIRNKDKNLTIIIKTDKADSGENALCYYNKDKTDTNKLDRALYEFLKKSKLDKNNNLSILLMPWNIFVFYHHFDKEYHNIERLFIK